MQLDPTSEGNCNNRAQAHNAPGQNAKAVADFEKPLELKSNASDRDEVEQWISRLK